MHKKISQSPDAAVFWYHNVKIFNTFDIHGDGNDIIEYHGDIDSDKCYLNEYSYTSFNNCNYYTDNSFNKYLLQHNHSVETPSMVDPQWHMLYWGSRCNFPYSRLRCGWLWVGDNLCLLLKYFLSLPWGPSTIVVFYLCQKYHLKDTNKIFKILMYTHQKKV